MASPSPFSLRRIALPNEPHAYEVHELLVRGRSAYSDYTQGRRDLDKITEYLDTRLAPLGVDGFNSKSQFEPYRSGLYCLKPGAHRILMIRTPRAWIIIDAFHKGEVKKNQQTKRIDAAEKTARELLAYRNNRNRN